MIRARKVLAVIPARGGSKGVPRKNIRQVGGKPLIAWTIAAAKSAVHVDRVILSSDDREIIKVAQRWGCDVPYVRDAGLAGDLTPTIDVVLDALDRCPGYDWVVLLQPTSPLRTADDIDQAIEMCLRSDAPACVSVCTVEQSPYWMFTLGQGGRLRSLLPGGLATRRQDLSPVFALNGAVYVARADWLRHEKKFITDDTVAYLMPADRSIDIDTESDFLQLKLLMENNNHVPLPSST